MFLSESPKQLVMYKYVGSSLMESLSANDTKLNLYEKGKGGMERGERQKKEIQG